MQNLSTLPRYLTGQFEVIRSPETTSQELSQQLYIATKIELEKYLEIGWHFESLKGQNNVVILPVEKAAPPRGSLAASGAGAVSPKASPDTNMT